MKTIIRNAAWVVCWDEGTKSHVYRRDVDVAFADGAITAIGRVRLSVSFSQRSAQWPVTEP